MNIRKNEEVRHIGDVQNLITSVILRQCEMFSVQDIYDNVEKNLERSAFAKNGARRPEVDVKGMVDETLNTLSNIGSIQYVSEEKKYKLSMSFPAVNKR